MWPLWTDQSRRLSPPLPPLLMKPQCKWVGFMRLTAMRSLTGTFPTLIDGATPAICWILGAVVMTFVFAIALLLMVYLVESLMVPFIQCRWFPMTWILANGKS